MARTPAKAPAKKAATKAASTKTAAKKTAAKTTKAAAKTVKAPAKVAKAPVKAAAKKVTKTAVKAGDILTLRHIAEAISESYEMTKRQANDLIGDVVEHITSGLKKGAKVRLTGLGILQVRKRPARTARNPRTGEPVKVKASKKVAFRAAKELKESI